MRAMAHGLFGDGLTLTKINLTRFSVVKFTVSKPPPFFQLVAEWPKQMAGHLVYDIKEVFRQSAKTRFTQKKTPPEGGV